MLSRSSVNKCVATIILGMFLCSLLSQPTIGQSNSKFTIPFKDKIAVKIGKKIYQQNCASCHGISLEGQVGWQDQIIEGKRLAPPHDETGHTWHHPDEVLFNMTKYGLEALIGRDYPNNMPIYEDILSDGELLAVLAYIKSTWSQRVIKIHDQINENHTANKNPT